MNFLIDFELSCPIKQIFQTSDLKNNKVYNLMQQKWSRDLTNERNFNKLYINSDNQPHRQRHQTHRHNHQKLDNALLEQYGYSYPNKTIKKCQQHRQSVQYVDNEGSKMKDNKDNKVGKICKNRGISSCRRISTIQQVSDSYSYSKCESLKRDERTNSNVKVKLKVKSKHTDIVIFERSKYFEIVIGSKIKKNKTYNHEATPQIRQQGVHNSVKFEAKINRNRSHSTLTSNFDRGVQAQPHSLGFSSLQNKDLQYTEHDYMLQGLIKTRQTVLSRQAIIQEIQYLRELTQRLSKEKANNWKTKTIINKNTTNQNYYK